MKDKEQLIQELSNTYNGHFTTSLLYQHGLSKYDISKLVEKSILERVSKGKYIYKDALNDDLALLQMNNSKMIYSNETALYLHNLTGIIPKQFSVTTESGYNLKKENLITFYVKPDLLNLGVIEMKNSHGNFIKVYDKERTICDIIKNKNRIETQAYIEGIQNYFKFGKPDLKKLSKYARILGISNKVYDVAALFMAP